MYKTRITAVSLLPNNNHCLMLKVLDDNCSMQNVEIEVTPLNLILLKMVLKAMDMNDMVVGKEILFLPSQSSFIVANFYIDGTFINNVPSYPLKITDINNRNIRFMKLNDMIGYTYKYSLLDDIAALQVLFEKDLKKKFDILY